MRRKDRALEREAALRILDQTEWMTLSMTQPDGTPYAVPVNMTRAGEWLYFHCAREGKKIDCLRACPQVCVTAVGHARVIPEQYTTEYESAVVFGTAEEVLEEEVPSRAGGGVPGTEPGLFFTDRPVPDPYSGDLGEGLESARQARTVRKRERPLPRWSRGQKKRKKMLDKCGRGGYNILR